MKLILSSFFLVCIFSAGFSIPAKNDSVRRAKSTTTTTTPRPTTTTAATPEPPIDEGKEIDVGDQQKHDSQKEVAKKRNVLGSPDDGSQEDDGGEEGEELEDGKTPEDYSKVIALAPSEDESRVENAVLKAEAYGEPASINQYRYYGRDDRRRKRTAISEGLLMGDARPKRELDLANDDALALFTLWAYPHLLTQASSNGNRWSGDDNTLDYNRENEDEEEIYPEPFYSQSALRDLLERKSTYDPWRQFKDKRFIVRRRRSSIFAEPQLKTPLYRRAIL